MSNLINKVKDALHSDKSTEQPEGTHGTHSSRAANAADPRIDSDRDHRAAPGSTTTGTGAYGSTTGTSGTNPLSSTSGHTGTHTGATTGTTTGGTYGSGPASNTAGPHKSDMMNKADPRVDSDLDGGRNMGANSGMTGTTGTTGYGNTAGTTSGMTGTHGHHAGNTGTGMTGTSGLATTSGSGMGGRNNVTGVNDPEGTHGPHSSRMANAADPRVDSDRDASRTAGGAHHGTHTTTGGAGYGSGTTTGTGIGSGSTTGTTGYGSGATTGTGIGSGNTAGYGTGPGPAPNTAGPHKSDVLNKVDPRVDSDLDNSKTMGQDKTYQSGAGGIARDPTDASQVPPSVLRKHVGDPSIEHGDHAHDRDRRNSTTTHQDTFRGI